MPYPSHGVLGTASPLWGLHVIPMMEDASLVVLCVICSALSKCGRMEWVVHFLYYGAHRV